VGEAQLFPLSGNFCKRARVMLASPEKNGEGFPIPDLYGISASARVASALMWAMGGMTRILVVKRNSVWHVKVVD
jgi:hypothetical protein